MLLEESAEVYEVYKENGVEDLTLMSTAHVSVEDNIGFAAHPDSIRNDAYFKVYNHTYYLKATKLIRLSFKEAKYFVHKGDGKQLWVLENKELKMIIDCLKSKPTQRNAEGFSTVWEFLIYLWNKECGFIWHRDYDEKYPEGCKPTSALLKNPRFVPLNTLMPDYMGGVCM
ncbi:MAG: hypothetical protein FWG87_11865 [Defluviitaleaceae bacterium]|nr:hypothetical protein [Defluviitaleaceae bacterium]